MRSGVAQGPAGCFRRIQMDALLCGSDHIARGALDALRADGIRVLEDLAIMGARQLGAARAAVPPTALDRGQQPRGARKASSRISQLRHRRRPAARHPLGFDAARRAWFDLEFELEPTNTSHPHEQRVERCCHGLRLMPPADRATRCGRLRSSHACRGDGGTLKAGSLPRRSVTSRSSQDPAKSRPPVRSSASEG